MKFSQLKIQLNGVFWGDHIKLDRLLVSRRRCPQCNLFFEYYGTSNASEYRAYGVCEPCDFAKLFWSEKVEPVTAKQSFLKAKV